MSRFRYYILPFNDNGTYQSDYINVSDDVLASSLSPLSETTSYDEYNIGLLKFNSFTLTLNNVYGRYSEPNQPQSIFRLKRSDCIVRITWSASDDISQCGNCECGNTFTNLETIIYEGLLVDEAAGFDIDTQQLKFKVIGFESLFDRAQTSLTMFASEEEGGSDLISQCIYTVLNQIIITNILTVDVANINITEDSRLGSDNELGGASVATALEQFLLVSNSSLYIKDRTVYVRSQSPSVDLKYSFYGASSNLGIENIVSLDDIRAGVNKLYNSFYWQSEYNKDVVPTPLIVELGDSTSIDQYGYFQKQIQTSLLGREDQILEVVQTYLDEYAFPKVELSLTTRFWYDTFALSFFDRVDIDNPPEFTAEYGEEIPIYGQAVYGSSRYPYGRWHYVIDQTKNFKILNRTIDFQNQLITFRLREI